ncbi:MAG TPA: T9SS type A sorting domain-containing protein, partial [Bacteroidota bacterium]|nr:T9SS type A sorting domain-containing protein [Bacteroidota bacterium]
SRVAYSTNAGVDWEPPVAIPSGNQPARIGANAWGLHYAGVFDTDSSTELYYQRTSDLGMNWEGTILTSAYDVFYDSPGLAITDAGDVYAVWRSVPEDSVNPDSEEFVRFRHSSDNGATWENVRTLNASKGVEFPIVAAAGSRVAVTWNNYPDTSFVPGQVLMVSTDFGATWSDILPVGYHGDFGLAFTNRYIHVVWSGYIGSPGWEIYYRRGVIGNVTSVGEEAVPSAFSLSQNYPNPFNGATTISYVLARRERVSLRVHNVYGELMGMLVDGTEPEGRHDVRWEPGTLASGVYFYRLQAGMHSESRKLLFMK